MFRVYGGQPVGMGNAGAIAGGIPLKDLFPNAPSDVGTPVQTPGVVRPGTKQRLKDIFPPGRGIPNLPSDHPLHDFVRRGFTGDLVQNLPSPGGSPYSELPKDYLEQRNPFGAPPTPPQQPAQPGVPVQLELPLAGSSNLPNALPGAPGNMFGMMMAQLPGGEQGPAQGPNTPVKFYRGLGYAPYGPGGGGLPPTPVRGA